jgi:hypothetical protein
VRLFTMRQTTPKVPSTGRARGVTVAAVLALASFTLAVPGGAEPVPPSSRRASLTAGVSLGDGDTALALSGALGVVIARPLSVEFEWAYARKLDFSLDLCPPPLVCILGGRVPVTGRTVSLVPHLVLDLLPATSRRRAYLQAGIGAGHVRQRYVIGPPLTLSLPQPAEFTRSNLVAAVSYGGGAAFALTRRLALGADVRVLHLFDTEAPLDRFIEPSGALTTVRAGARLDWVF